MSRLSKPILKKIGKVYKKTGSIRETARKMGISRNAVRRELRSTGSTNSTNKDSVNARKTTPKKSKLDPHKAKIRVFVENDNLSGVRILEEIQQLGYQGGSTILNEYIQTIKPRRGRGLTTVIDHQPGHEGQMDWSPHRDLLIIDEVREIRSRSEYPSLFIDLVNVCQGCVSIIITSSISIQEWGSALGNASITNAIVDRLFHNACVINITHGRSYRTQGPNAPEIISSSSDKII